MSIFWFLGHKGKKSHMDPSKRDEVMFVLDLKDFLFLFRGAGVSSSWLFWQNQMTDEEGVLALENHNKAADHWSFFNLAMVPHHSATQNPTSFNVPAGIGQRQIDELDHDLTRNDHWAQTKFVAGVDSRAREVIEGLWGTIHRWRPGNLEGRQMERKSDQHSYETYMHSRHLAEGRPSIWSTSLNTQS